jgi:hypothetical protein
MRKATKPKVTPKRHHIYVIELPEAVGTDSKFLKQNPDYVGGQTCFYVGMTGLTPEKRFEQHQTKHKKSARLCKKYGVVKLRPEWYEQMNPMTYDDAVSMEVRHAEFLRQQGFGVYQN